MNRGVYVEQSFLQEGGISADVILGKNMKSEEENKREKCEEKGKNKDKREN